MNKINNEIWRPVKGYEEFYAVSDKGRVKSVERTVVYKDGRRRHYKEQVLKPAKKKNGYLYVSLCENGKVEYHLVHRLVALTFIPNPCPEKYDVVNHKIEGDEGKLINTVENLEWCDIPYNNAYGTHNERSAKARINGKRSKTVYQYTLSGDLVKEWQSAHEIERQMGWSNSHISACCRGKLKTAYNYVWSYTRL